MMTNTIKASYTPHSTVDMLAGFFGSIASHHVSGGA